MEQLQQDREQMARHAALPSWFHPILGIVAAGFVVSPALPGGGERTTTFMFALVAIIFLVQKAQRTTGVKVSNAGFGGHLVVGSLVATVLIGFCVTLGLVSLGLNWWGIVPALAVFVAVVLLSRLHERLVLEQLTHGR